jgi:hypothetical protein
MRFTYNDKTYVLEFSRKHRERADGQSLVTTVRPMSTHPYTTVKVIEVDPRNPAHRYLYREATVGCWHKEVFTLERGRIHALRAVGKNMPADFKAAMWKAYTDRETIKKKQPYTEETEVVTLGHVS